MSTSKLIATAQKAVLVIGDQVSGWSVVTNAKAEHVRSVQLNIELQFDGSGYLLCYSSDIDQLYGDTWHLSQEEAIQVALEEFGVRRNEWRHA